MKTLVSFTVNILVFFAVLSSTIGYKKELQTPQKKFFGPVTTIGQGTVRSFLKFDEKGRPKIIGVVFSESALKHLPKQRQLIEVQIPQKIVQLPFDHISFGWGTGGEEAISIFADDYIAVHFNMISSEERNQIEKNDPLSERLPEPSFIPVDFVPGIGSVARVGKQWSNKALLELHKAERACAMLMHSYNKKVVSFTPTFTIDFLRKNRTSTYDLSLPEAFQQPGKFYPTQYSIAYDAGKKEYSVNLLEFVKK